MFSDVKFYAHFNCGCNYWIGGEKDGVEYYLLIDVDCYRCGKENSLKTKRKKCEGSCPNCGTYVERGLPDDANDYEQVFCLTCENCGLEFEEHCGVEVRYEETTWEEDKIMFKIGEKGITSLHKEDRKVIRELLNQARDITEKDLSKFISNLLERSKREGWSYRCYFMSICWLAILKVFNFKEDSNGTAFEASKIMWDVLKQNFIPGGFIDASLVDLNDLLYPQYEYRFTTIPKKTWERLKEKANNEFSKEIESLLVAPEVKNHWIKIKAGKIPFRLKVNKRKD